MPVKLRLPFYEPFRAPIPRRWLWGRVFADGGLALVLMAGLVSLALLLALAVHVVRSP